MRRFLKPVLCVLPLLLLGGCLTVKNIRHLSENIKGTHGRGHVILVDETYNPDHFEKLKKTNKCVGQLFSGCHLYGANLQSAFLFKANLNEAHLKGANLQDANLKGANLKGTNLREASLQGANLQQAELTGSVLLQANLQGASLQGANLQQARLQRANLYRANLEDANLHEAILWRANLQKANLQGASLKRARLYEADLRETNLQGADLQGANLWGAKLDPEGIKIAIASGARNVPKKPSPTVPAQKTTSYNPEHLKRLKETNSCPRCKLQGADLWFRNLQGADLKGANLQSADLRGAKLQGADLKGANLQSADLRGAHLKGANLQDANLKGANLLVAKLNAEGIQTAKATGAINVPKPVVVAKKTPKVTPKKKPNPPVVAKATPKKAKPPAQSGSGSGFFVSRFGHVITNEHVVRDCKSVTVGDNAKKQSPVSVEETDRRNDLALLKLSTLTMASAETKSLIRKLGVKVVPLASDGLLRLDDIELGEKVMVAGYPYGDIFSDTIKVTFGNVSATRGMGDDSGQFQLSAPVQPGNSGGPIYDENGNIVGVVISQLNKLKIAKAIGSMPENVNFGIKTSTVRQFLTSGGLPTKWSTRSKGMSTKELAKIAQKQTLMVMCHQ